MTVSGSRTLPWLAPIIGKTDQHPPATDVVLHLNVPCAGGSPAYLEIELPDGRSGT